MNFEMPERLTAVMFQRERLWVGVFLEHYLVAQAETNAELIAEMSRIVTAHLVISAENNEQPFKMFPPAPQHYHDLFDKDARPDISIIYKPPKEVRAAVGESTLMLHEVRKSA